MHVVLVAVLVAGGIAATPPAAAEPYNCPPACDSIPGSAWVAPDQIPLNTRYRWPQLAGLAVTAPEPLFRFEELCGTVPTPEATPAAPASKTTVHPADPRSYAVAQRAIASSPPGQWQLQAQVIHWRGETWRGAQLVQDVFAAAVSALRSCQRANPAASVSLTVAEPDAAAAVISGPVILHQYLVANPANSTISELALWSTAPPLTPWPTILDAAVLDTLTAPLCTAYIGSCL